MEKLKHMKESLVHAVQSQVDGHLNEVDTKELGEAVDMIKDLSEAIYYCTIVESMEKSEKEGGNEQHKAPMYFYTERMYPREMAYREFPMMYRDYPEYYSPYGRDRMYADGRGGSSGGNSNGGSSGGNSGSGGSSGGSSAYTPMMITGQPVDKGMLRDVREGRSPMARRSYMEAKAHQHDSASKMKELETYMQELSQDLTEMIQGSSPEEKQLLQQRIATLATKIK